MFSRNRLLKCGLVAGAFLCCFVCFILVPQIKSYTVAKKELVVENDKLLKARAAVAAFKLESERLEQAKEEYGTQSEPFRQVTRDGSDTIFLGLMAASSHIAAAEIMPGEVIEKKHTLELPVRLVLQGDYRSLIDFCRTIENNNSANLLEIRSLQIETINRMSSAKGRSAAIKAGTVIAEIGIVIFSVKDPEGNLYPEKISKWLTGRGDVFKPAGALVPVPELDGYLETHAEQFHSPVLEAQGVEKGITVQKTEPATAPGG